MGASPVIAVGRRDGPLALARELGADATVDTSQRDLARTAKELTGGRGVDVAIEAVGSTDLLLQATRALADHGQIGVYGVPAQQEALLRWGGLAPNWQLRFIQPREQTVHDLALKLVRLGYIDLRPFVTHVVPLDQIGEAFRLLDAREALKVTIAIHPEVAAGGGA
jgi:threonine dehydrogenase-like Zn-dependent dehydrogenase